MEQGKYGQLLETAYREHHELARKREMYGIVMGIPIALLLLRNLVPRIVDESVGMFLYRAAMLGIVGFAGWAIYQKWVSWLGGITGALWVLLLYLFASNFFASISLPFWAWWNGFPFSEVAATRIMLALWPLLGLRIMTNAYLNTRGRNNLHRVIAASYAASIFLSYPLLRWFETYLSAFPIGIVPVVLPLAGLLMGMTILAGGAYIGLQTFLVYAGGFIFIFSLLLEIDNKLWMMRHSRMMIDAYLARVYRWWFSIPAPEPLPDESKGARFADPREVEAVRKAEGAAFGWTGGKPLFLENEKHVTIMASTRSGKGVTLIIPHLLRYPGSAFVLDPKGENCKATWRHRQIVNDKVRALDPFGISGKPRARFNPLSRFTPDTMDADSKALSGALITTTGRETDPHFIGAAQQLGAGVILHVYTSPDIPPEHKDLVTVRSLLLGDIKGTLKTMSYSDAAGGMVAELAFSFLDTPEKERGSIISVAQRQTEILDNPYIAACLSAKGEGEEIDFNDWHTGTMTVFLCLSAPKFPVFNRWLRLVLTSALDTMTDRLNPPSLPVCFMLDELATLGHLPAVENAVGLAAGYGIQLWSVFQDIAQMREIYRGRWASFIGNSGVRAIFNLDDFDTAHYWSQFMGGRLVETTSRQENIFGLSQGQGIGEAMRPLRAAEELMTDYAKAKMLVLAQGEHPIETGRVAYFNDKTLQGLWDDPRYDVPPMPAPVIKKMAMEREPDAEPANTGREDNGYDLRG